MDVLELGLEEALDISGLNPDHIAHVLIADGYMAHIIHKLDRPFIVDLHWARTTLSGRDHLLRLRSPRKAWVKDNWAFVFAAVVGAATMLSAITQTVVSLRG